MRRDDGSADHYLFVNEQGRHFLPNPIPPILADFLRASRQGKKTVALVGAGWNSAPWAPWGEDGVEVWGMNESHSYPWFKVEGIARWFQLHPKSTFTKERGFNHWEWLQKEHPFPIYMQQVYDDVPSSVKYPLREIQKALIGNIYRGEEKIKKLFSSTFNYQLAQALYENVDRIEFYGIEMLVGGEYIYQREAMAFWLGKADGMGVEWWMPESCSLLAQPLYAYEEIREGDSGKISWSAEQKGR